MILLAKRTILVHRKYAFYILKQSLILLYFQIKFDSYQQIQT